MYRGDSVSYAVSKGPEMVTVPDVVGLQRLEAHDKLEGPDSPSRKTSSEASSTPCAHPTPPAASQEGVDR